MPKAQRGFTLLIAVVLASVLLSVGLALLDIAYKQITLSSTARQSQFAFYSADSAMECVLYWDQQRNAFDYTTPLTSITCNQNVIAVSSAVSGGLRTSTFSMPCAGGGTSASVTVTKDADNATNLYANGFNTCSASNPRRIERGLKATYSGWAGGVPAGPTGSFTISPAVSGKTTWNLAVDGPLNLSAGGIWTITPIANLSVSTEIWGAGGGGGSGTSNSQGPGGGGAYGAGTLSLQAGQAYTLVVGGGGVVNSDATTIGGGGGAGSWGQTSAASGGGYSGIFSGAASLANHVIVVGGGGGGARNVTASVGGGAGGSTTGQSGSYYGSTAPATGGTQSAGGAGSTGGASPGTNGTALAGGRGGNMTSGGGDHSPGGGGGGGYYGGGGGLGGEFGITTGCGGAGGSSKATGVTSPTLTGGSGPTPGNSSDADRGTAGQGGSAGAVGQNGNPGKIIIKL